MGLFSGYAKTYYIESICAYMKVEKFLLQVLPFLLPKVQSNELSIQHISHSFIFLLKLSLPSSEVDHVASGAISDNFFELLQNFKIL